MFLKLLLAFFVAGWSLVLQAAGGLAGTWSASAEGESLVVFFDGKGGGHVNNRPVRYQELGSLLMVEDAGQLDTYQFQIQGNRMTVSGGQFAGPVTFVRGSTNAAAGTKPAAKTRSTGVADGELVGKWCKVTNFSANAGGGSQSSACFELRADGTYVYGSESSMSAYGGGMYGATSSSGSDAGRWSTDGRSIKSHSQSGQVSTYSLEKRNHPRNRDPMLCLDGTCYVTYWQKRPW